MRLRHVLPLIVLLALPAMAQERSVMGGFQVGLTKPTGGSDLNTNPASISSNDLVDGHTGINLGGHVSFNLQNGHMIRLRLDDTYTSGSLSRSAFPNIQADTKVESIGFMGDYLYHFSGKNDGFYITAGVGLEITRVQFDDSFNGFSESDAKMGIALAGGLGWQFTPHVGLEARYASSHPTGLDSPYGKYDLKNDRWVVSVNFSF